VALAQRDRRPFHLPGGRDRAPRGKHRLAPGNEHAVPAKVAHIVRNVADGRSRFMVIQGIGPYDYHAVGG
jgi:hypothetical protein